MPASRIGTIDPLDTSSRAYVDENLKEVGVGSTDAAFVYHRSDLARVTALRAESGIVDEPARVQAASHKIALADAERRVKAAEAEVNDLRSQVQASDAAAAKADKAK